MTDRKALLSDLQKQVTVLEKDLRAQVEEELPDVRRRLRAEYDRAFKLERTAATWPAWRDERVTQAAAAWALGTVFVRFCEDNGLLGTAYLAGRTLDDLVLAEEAQEEFFRQNPAETDRGWLLAAFAEIGSSQAGRLLFDQRHNALFQIDLSHDAAKELIAFWRRRGADGQIVHVFDGWDTRFLGDLYQDLSESARKTYALLQTPDFVEEFILDYTLTPAINDFGHDVVKMIDPTCGSGHFVLGAFHRLLNEWNREAPGRDERERVRLALEAVHGVDINPFAVAIARFRLFIAALQAAGITTLAEARDYHLPINIAIGDSLIKARQLHFEGMSDQELKLASKGEQSALFAPDHEQTDLLAVSDEDSGPVDELAEFSYFTEDLHDFPDILKPGRYHAVVGNPPYIQVKDKNLSKLYRELYSACSGQYALSVPFTQRFFELARSAESGGGGAGYAGQITANSFMKREFGKKLIESFFKNEVELTHVIDTSGAYIPGHGTPTVIMFGRNRKWNRQETVRAVMGIRGEPDVPPNPRLSHVWQEVVSKTMEPGPDSVWVGVVDSPRARFESYPWGLRGGGAADLKDSIDRAAAKSLGKIAEIGVSATTGDDEAFLASSPPHWMTMVVPVRRIVEGEEVRDFIIDGRTVAVWPYDEKYSRLPLTTSLLRWFWPNRRSLERRKKFSVAVEEIPGIAWYEFRELYQGKLSKSPGIAMCTVASHGHFSLDLDGMVFNRHAPLIKLKGDVSVDGYHRILGVLNSSIGCFWLKQMCQDRGNRGGERSTGRYAWESFFEFTSTKLKSFPLPATLPCGLPRELDALARSLQDDSPGSLCLQTLPSRQGLSNAHGDWLAARRRMIALQEELDWEVYSIYGLPGSGLIAAPDTVPSLNLGERAFEIVMARNEADDEAAVAWFERHGSVPITELPGHWPDEYKAVVEKRIALIESDRFIGLLERPEYKRRWALVKDNKPWGWAEQEAAALRNWLLDRCEARELWFHELDGQVQPRTLTTSELADLLRPDADFVSVAELYAPGKDVEQVVADLTAEEHVPFLAQLRYKDSGLDKRADWEDVWEQQRVEDAAAEARVKEIRDAIPVPPKYVSGDFRKPSFWRHRGKLDVPKERFISYPHASRDGDPALLLGWAGWDHREQAQALATLIVDREQNDGWDREKLAPLLAGLREVLPWVKQWHADLDPVYSASPADIYAGFLDDTCGRLHLTEEDLTSWRPPARRGRRPA